MILRTNKFECWTSTHHNLNLFFERNNMTSQNSPQSGTRKNKATGFGLLKELVFWPVVALATLITAVFGPDVNLVLLTFFLAVTILITTVGKEQRAICWTMVAFGIVNGLYVAFPSYAPTLFQDPRFWIANRLLFAVGIAVFIQPLFGRIFETEKGKTRTLIVASLLLFIAFALHTFGRPEYLPSTTKCVEVFVETLTCKLQRDPVTWYTVDMLWDDICIGVASGLIVGALTAKTKKKK